LNRLLFENLEGAPMFKPYQVAEGLTISELMRDV